MFSAFYAGPALVQYQLMARLHPDVVLLTLLSFVIVCCIDATKNLLPAPLPHPSPFSSFSTILLSTPPVVIVIIIVISSVRRRWKRYNVPVCSREYRVHCSRVAYILGTVARRLFLSSGLGSLLFNSTILKWKVKLLYKSYLNQSTKAPLKSTCSLHIKSIKPKTEEKNHVNNLLLHNKLLKCYSSTLLRCHCT